MSVEQIEKILAGISDRIDAPAALGSLAEVLPFLQCQLLLHIYKKLDDINDRLDSIDREIFDSRHNR